MLLRLLPRNPPKQVIQVIAVRVSNAHRVLGLGSPVTRVPSGLRASGAISLTSPPRSVHVRDPDSFF